MEQTMVAGLYATDSEGRPVLVGGRRKSDGRIRFPMLTGPEAERYEPWILPRVGRLWAYTSQTFQPNSPPYAVESEGEFKAFWVGYVELPNSVIVQSRLLVDDPELLTLGQLMELKLVTLSIMGRGRVQSFAFAPTAAQEQEHE